MPLSNFFDLKDKMSRLVELLQQGILIGDGAMGTMLYQQGAFLNTCFEELNLTRPEMVKKIHSQYVEAGADFIETNTYGANTFKLARFGLADRLEQVIVAATQIARQAAQDKTLIAGSIGPLGIDLPQVPEHLKQNAFEAFMTQAKALHGAGVDFLLLETFTNNDELAMAINAAVSVSDKPIVAQMVCTAKLETPFGLPIEQAIAILAAHSAVTAVGLNCSVGPSDMLEAIKKIRDVTDKPLSAQPNAGLPRQVEGRMLYMCTPEYMAEYAKRFFESGVKIIGGCCGTTPAHIREINKAVRPLAKAMTKKPSSVTISISSQPKQAGVEPKPFAAKSVLGKKIA